MKHNTITLSLVALSLCALSACSSLQDNAREQSKELLVEAMPPVPQAFSVSVPSLYPEPSLSDFASDSTVNWLLRFEDPNLLALVEEAQSNNPSLQVLASNVEAAKALVRQAGAGLIPRVNVGGGASANGVIDGSASDRFNLVADLSWEVDIWGRIRSGEFAAQESLAAVESDLSFAQFSLAANVARAYFLTREANRLAAIAESIIETLQETHRIVSVQVENGIGDQGSLALVTTDLANAQDALIATKAAQRTAARALETLLGRYPSAALQIDDTLPLAPLNLQPGIPSSLLERRPDLVAAERRIAAAYNQVESAKAAKLPALGLTGSLNASSSSLSNILNGENILWQAAANLLYPLIDGGVLDAQVDIRTAEQEAAVANYVATALQAFSETEQAIDDATVISLRQEALQLALDSAQKALRVASLQYEEGEIGLLDVLQIQQRVFSAQRNLASIKRANLIQYIDLSLTLGGTWDENLN